MKPLTFLAAVAAVICLAACGQQAATSTSAAASAAKAPTCHQQYKTWQAGPAKAAGKKLDSALSRVQSASSAEDIPGLDTALRSAGKAASKLQADKPPACADPKGYYGKMLGRITAAGDNAESGASSFGDLILAEAPLKTVPGIEKKLTAELARTAGKNR